MDGLCLICGTVLSFIDWLILRHSWPAKQTSAASESVNFEPTPPHSHQKHHRRPTHSQAERLSTQKTDGPSPLHTPRPDMQFISWKTCRRAKGGRAFYLVALHQPLLSMLYLGSFHPPADRRVYMGPSVKDPRQSHPESLHLCSPPRLKGGVRLTGPTGQGVMMLLVCVYVYDCVPVITTVRSCVNAGFVHHIVRYSTYCTMFNKQVEHLLSERMCYNEIIELLSRKTDYSRSRIKQFITAFLFITID